MAWQGKFDLCIVGIEAEHQASMPTMHRPIFKVHEGGEPSCHSGEQASGWSLKGPDPLFSAG